MAFVFDANHPTVFSVIGLFAATSAKPKHCVVSFPPTQPITTAPGTFPGPSPM